MKDGVPAWSVVLLVCNGDNSVLAINRGFNARDPALPGGDSEPGDETPAATAARELLEETGLQAVELRCVDKWEGERGQPVYAFFIPRWKGKRLVVSGEGKPFWTQPKRLLIKTAQFRDKAQDLFVRLGGIAA